MPARRSGVGLEPLIWASQARKRLGRLAFQRGDLLTCGREGRALDQAGKQVVALFQEREIVLAHVPVAVGEQPAGLELDQDRCDEQELRRDLEVEAFEQVELVKVPVHDVGQPDLVKVHALLGDEAQEDVERPLEHVGVDCVRHPSNDTGGLPSCDGWSGRRAHPGALPRPPIICG